MSAIHFPTLNACLNLLSGCLLVLGYYFVRKRALEAHKKAMIGACIASILFLVCYLYYHYHHGSTKFQGEGWIRPVYFFVLITHTVLATAIVPFVLMTLWRAFKNRLEEHASLARKVFPFWLYVSVTGVIVYWMLYQM